MTTADKLDHYYSKPRPWTKELNQLREILLSTELGEELKWGAPCYMLDGTNVVGVGGFKSYFGLWFFQGALLDDSHGVLVNAQPGKTQAMRQWRMTCETQINVRLIKDYLQQAIRLAQSGQQISRSPSKPLQIPMELSVAFEQSPELADAFSRLRPGLQREFADYISDAKRETTRMSRLAKIEPMIQAGEGLNDRYRK